jgi:hypothetical protein
MGGRGFGRAAATYGEEEEGYEVQPFVAMSVLWDFVGRQAEIGGEKNQADECACEGLADADGRHCCCRCSLEDSE